jgi:DNA-binding transcriptional MocR family regulator
MTDGGVDLARLEQTLARPEVKAFYTIPTFHNPMGTTTNLAHRRALLAVARRAGVPVIEDGYEMDLRFAGAPVAPLAGSTRAAWSCTCSRSRSRSSRARASAR